MILAVSGPALASPIDTFNGLPTHPLVVHGAVSLVLVAALGAVVSLVPRWRSWLLPTTATISVLAALSTIVATETGEGLEHRLAQSELIESHAEAGEATRTAALALAVLLIGWWLVDRALRRAGAAAGAPEATGAVGGSAGGRGGVATATAAPVNARTAPAGLRVGALVLSIVTVLVSLATAYLLYLTGDRGAKAVWGDLPATPAASAPAPSS